MEELSADYLREHYITLRKTRYQISEETGVDPVRIGSLLQKYGIHRRSVKRHGLSKHPLNIMWCGMKERCNNPTADNYKWYGGKGIHVCDEWYDFQNFYDWAQANGWRDGLSIDRIDNSKDYCPDNCRFVDFKSQFRNRSTNTPITIGDETLLSVEWAERIGVRRSMISKWKARHGMDYVIQRISERLQQPCESKASPTRTL